MSSKAKQEVALIRVDTLPAGIGVRSIDDRKWYVAGPLLGSQHNGWHDSQVEVIRHLAVIDPENREVVAQVLGDDVAPSSLAVEVTQRRLREYADPTPPRPAEPTDLATRAIDADGHEWVRSSRDNLWHCFGARVPREWDELIDECGPLEVS